MMGRKTLREIREALAAAKATGTKVRATAQAVKELESLTRILEREVEEGRAAEKPGGKMTAEQGAAADGGSRRDSRRSAKPRSPRRR